MDVRENFYVVFSSNASMEINPLNTVAHFTNNLLKPIELDESQEWVVGLNDISFTRSWLPWFYHQRLKLVRMFCNKITQEGYPDVFVKNGNIFAVLIHEFIPPRAFKTLSDMTSVLNKHLEEVKSSITFSADDVAHTVTINSDLKTSDLYATRGEEYKYYYDFVLLSEELLHYLQLDAKYEQILSNITPTNPEHPYYLAYHIDKTIEIDDYTNNKRKRRIDLQPDIVYARDNSIEYLKHIEALGHKSKNSTQILNEDSKLNPIIYEEDVHKIANFIYLDNFPIESDIIDIEGSINSLFVYSDVVEKTHVGDSMSPLLAAVNVLSKTDFGQQVYHRFENPYYKPIAKHVINSIEIDIRTEFGNLIPFQFGRTWGTLHFKRIK